jgi:hypothetical protein
MLAHLRQRLVHAKIVDFFTDLAIDALSGTLGHRLQIVRHKPHVELAIELERVDPTLRANDLLHQPVQLAGELLIGAAPVELLRRLAPEKLLKPVEMPLDRGLSQIDVLVLALKISLPGRDQLGDRLILLGLPAR